MKQPVERRLAAILAADVAGYSRLMDSRHAQPRYSSQKRE
jgi:class 3 adenylate cyclase